MFGKRLAALSVFLLIFSSAHAEEKLSAVLASMTEAQFRETQQAANGGDARALTLVAMAYQEGQFVQRNEDTAFRLLRKAADQGFPPAQNMLGSAYELGSGTYSDKEIASRRRNLRN